MNSSFESHLATPKDGTLSLWWVILYLGLHLLVGQIFFGPYVFLFLRVLFILVAVGVLLRRRNWEALRGIFLGRWLTGRKDWILALGFTVSILVSRMVLSSVFGSQSSPPTLNEFLLTAMVPAINEEIAFRGMILGALMAHSPARHAGAVLLSSLLFVGCHHLGNPVPLGFLIALSVQSLLYGFCFVTTRCLPLCMFLHLLWNSFSLWHG